MPFRPDEVIFCPTARCNLSCAHCVPGFSRGTLSAAAAMRFLAGCRRAGIGRVGFSGGEPFLAPDLLVRLIRAAVREGLAFDRIMTNGVWWPRRAACAKTLGRIARAGYDGSIAVSVDAFHRQDLRKVAAFVDLAISTWRRPDIVSIAYTGGVRESRTHAILRRLAAALGASVKTFGCANTAIVSPGLFIRLLRIDLSPVGRARALKDPWDGKWFREDRCAGPGNVLFVGADGAVKPCCGYATDLSALTIGNVRRDSPAAAVRRARSDRFIATVFGSGLERIRERLAARGYRFPGKTSNHCFFCRYLLTGVPSELLERCLDRKG